MNEQVPLNRTSGKRYGLAALMLAGVVTLALSTWFVYAKTIRVDVVEKEDVQPIMVVQKPVEVDLSALDPVVEEPEPEVQSVRFIPPQVAPTQPKERVVYRDRPAPKVSKAATSAPIVVAAAAPSEQGGSLITPESSVMGAAPPSGLGVARVRNDLSRRINRGVPITGTMQTRLDTTFSGQAACQIDRYVYSADGETPLLHPGDMMLGTYDSGMISPGVRRIALIWDMIKGRRVGSGIEITLNTQGTDTLGTTGMAARIDNHFWQQWNSVILASFIDVAVHEATRDNNNTGAIILGGVANDTSSLAQEILRQTGRIQPTAYADHGARCATTLAHDLVFAENVAYVN